MIVSRRSLLIGASLLAAPAPAWARNLARGDFTHGVASGDPTASRVMLWTRFAGAGGASGRIGWEVADDENFRHVVARGNAGADAVNDYCVKVDVGGLAPGRPYFYRFLSGSGPSVTGRTRTAPGGNAESLNIALFSCANMPWGYFHAYGHAAVREDIDLAVHVGDYIYEYQRGEYPTAAQGVAERMSALEPENEVVSLADYYGRYAAYHTDQDLLELRRLKPMSVVWDDHEIANDTWREGAQNHQPATEGAFTDRVAAASKAYFDWMPIRRPSASGIRVYRSLDWGNLARIVFIDTRLIGRDKQIDYRATLAPQLAQAGAEVPAIVARFKHDVLDDPSRTMMGPAQEAWFAQQLAESKAAGQPWQIVAQQVVMAEQLAPAALLDFLPADTSPGSRAWFAAGAQMSALGLPWNLDCWNGYPAARARFLDACVANASNAVVLGGDSHNCWVNNLAAASGSRLAAIELAGGSVSSPGFERTLSNAAPGQREAIMRGANAPLAYCDLTNRGYAALKFTRASCEAEWLAFADITTPHMQAPAVTRMSAAPSATAGPSAWSIAS
jgi:alkaline phosphatase D